MSTTVRIVCEVEITVDTWSDKSSFEDLAQQAVREGVQKLESIRRKDGDFRLLKVNEVKFVTHGIKWDAAKGQLS